MYFRQEVKLLNISMELFSIIMFWVVSMCFNSISILLNACLYFRWNGTFFDYSTNIGQDAEYGKLVNQPVGRSVGQSVG